MKLEEFTIALSQKEGNLATREISLKIKSVFVKEIKYLIILFTPHYSPSNISKTIGLTLNPKHMFAIEAPHLLFEGKIIDKGVIACCINKEGLEIKKTFTKTGGFQEISSTLEPFFKKLRRKGFQFVSFVSPKVNFLSYSKNIKFSLGKIFNLLGAGYIKKYSQNNCQIIDNTLNDGVVNIAMRGVQINTLKLGGYVALGRPFSITKIAPSRNILMEIDGKPAVDIYKKYLDKKFDIFLKNRLFQFYPLGIRTNKGWNLVSILECLGDGSLICLGDLEEKKTGNIMFLDSTSFAKNLPHELTPIKNSGPGLVFVINSLTRKKILRDNFKNEMQIIKQALGDNLKIIGICSDYYFYSDEERGDIKTETSNIFMTVWQ